MKLNRKQRDKCHYIFLGVFFFSSLIGIGCFYAHQNIGWWFFLISAIAIIVMIQLWYLGEKEYRQFESDMWD
jgi:hypothetical protein